MESVYVPSREELTYFHRGTSHTFFCENGQEKNFDKQDFIVVLIERAKNTHYRLVNVASGKLCYEASKAVVCGLKDALEWKENFLMRQYPDIYDKYYFFSIMPYNQKTLDWIACYMPKKRGTITSAQRLEVYKKYSGHCAYCGKEISMPEMQVDHVESHYRHQGKDALENYLPSCRDCNLLKSDYLLEEFRRVLIPRCIKKGKRNGLDIASRICRAYGLFQNPKKKIVFYFEKEKSDVDS